MLSLVCSTYGGNMVLVHSKPELGSIVERVHNMVPVRSIEVRVDSIPALVGSIQVLGSTQVPVRNRWFCSDCG